LLISATTPISNIFADAITEDLTTDLSRIKHSFVISRNTAFTYRNKAIDTRQIGRELGVRYVLEGSVIDAETDAHLWTGRYLRDTADLFALQTDFTRRIAAVLGTKLIAAEAARPKEHPDALDYILRGRAAEQDPPAADIRAKAMGQFERALTVDPDSVEAKIRLAGELIGPTLNGTMRSNQTDIVRAETLIGEALAAWPRSSLAHYTKA
jgi:hypothetical protein